MTSDHGFFISFSILLLISPAGAQSGTPPPPYSFSAFSPSVATVLVVIIAAMFFIGFFSIYLRLCSDDTTGHSLNPLAAAAASIRRRSAGLDASVIDSFPILLYSEVEEHKIGKGVLECAVCLNEFEEEETLRLIPKCDHVFHPVCIDAWLASHVTCPVCRADLTPKSGDAIHAPELEIAGAAETQNRANNDFSDRIVVDQEPEIDQGGSLNRRPRIFGKFPRSHSTGHSLFRPGINTERFTLRLPEHVRKEVMTRALHRTTTFSVTEESNRRGRRTGDGSNRGARSYRRLDRTVMSDRWVFSVPFFSQAQSMKSPRVTADGEGSTGRGMRSAVKLPSFKCLEPGADEAALVSAGPARPPI